MSLPCVLSSPAGSKAARILRCRMQNPKPDFS
jgi:hypothetical protein